MTVFVSLSHPVSSQSHSQPFSVSSRLTPLRGETSETTESHGPRTPHFEARSDPLHCDLCAVPILHGVAGLVAHYEQRHKREPSDRIRVRSQHDRRRTVTIRRRR